MTNRFNVHIHVPDVETRKRVRDWLTTASRMIGYAAPYELLDALATGKLILAPSPPMVTELGYIRLDAYALSPEEVREIECRVCGNALEVGQVYTTVYTNGTVGGICCESCTQQ